MSTIHSFRTQCLEAIQASPTKAGAIIALKEFCENLGYRDIAQALEICLGNSDNPTSVEGTVASNCGS